jgi:AraC family transcriptional regulator
MLSHAGRTSGRDAACYAARATPQIPMPTSAQVRRPGELNAAPCAQRRVAGFILTEARYAPALRLPRHAHELASFCVVLAGGYQETVGVRTRCARAGTTVVHPAGEAHSNHHDPAGARVLIVEVADARCIDLPGLARLFADPWDSGDPRLALYGLQLGANLREADTFTDLSVEALVLEMLDAARAHQLPEVRGARWLERVREQLEAPAPASPSLRALSERAGVHPVHLARAFRRAFGCSIGEYARRRQVVHALTLLEDPSLTLSAVACQAGFADQSHMTRRVRAHTGLTPRAWRMRRRGQ